MRSRFDRTFDEWQDGRERAWTPAIDDVRADLPGLKPEEVKIEVEDDILRISGEHTRWRCPWGSKAKQIKAKTHDDVVEVTIPLPKEAKKEAVKITPTAG